MAILLNLVKHGRGVNRVYDVMQRTRFFYRNCNSVCGGIYINDTFDVPV